MNKKELETIFEYYILRLNGLANRKLRAIRYNELQEEIDGELYGNFNLFEDIKSIYINDNHNVIGEVVREKKNKFGPCSLDKHNYQYPCTGYVKYRGKEFPVYLDDYGMDEFIEIRIGEEYKQISLRYDWYYELDKQFDLERFILTNTKEGYQELLDELESSSWYQKLF